MPIWTGRKNQGATAGDGARDNPDPLLDLPWRITAQQLNIGDGRWNWNLSGMPMRAGAARGSRVDNWQQGLEKATFTGRLNVLTQGDARKGNAVLNLRPGSSARKIATCRFT